MRVLTGKLGVATITRGPAVTNSVTALTEATRNRTPMLLVAGDTVFARRGHMQDIDQRSVLLPTGAGFEQLRSGETAIRRSFCGCSAGTCVEERPIVLNVPEDVFDEEASEKPHIPPPRARQAWCLIGSDGHLTGDFGLKQTTNHSRWPGSREGRRPGAPSSHWQTGSGRLS